MTNENRYWTSDASLHIECDTPMHSHEMFKSVCRLMRKLGFTIGKDPRIERDYKILSKSHRAGNHGDLQCKLEYYPRGMKVEFYQNINFENPNGGEYDFGRTEKMPYLIRLRFQWAMAKLVAFLSDRGFFNANRDEDWFADPLNAFNVGWAMDRDHKEIRFPRRADGWPTDAELNLWSRTGANGQTLDQGQVNYIAVRGRFVRCRIYDGINGMWKCLYGPSSMTCVSAGCIYSEFPGRGRRFSDSDRRKKLARMLEKSVESQDFLRAHAIKTAMAQVAS